MIDAGLLIAFVPAALALNLTPGADMMFCLAQGMRGGPARGWAASAGISAGAVIHGLLTGLGLGALVQTFPAAFGVIRWAGAGYLLWLAWKTWQSPIGAGQAGRAAPMRPARAFRDGLIVNLSNPKVILFILAFIPQFVDPARPVLPQFAVYAAVLAAGGFVVNGMVGVFAGGIGAKLAHSPRLEQGLRFGSSGIFAALAARLGWEALRP